MKARTSAWPLAFLFAGLVVYASLYPFTGWRDQGVVPLAFLQAPLPQYWTGFDVASNLVGYAPMGFLLMVALHRSGAGRSSWLVALGLPVMLSLTVETLQSYLPARVPSNLDLALNVAGAALGIALAMLIERLGALRRWSQIRANWFEPSAHGALVLLALWPFALLYPQPVPFGLGQVWERLETGLTTLLIDTPFLEWIPVIQLAPAPLSPLAEAFCIALSLLSPVLMGYGDMRSQMRRLVFCGLLLGGAVGVGGLSAALTYGPDHAWAWLTPQALLGLVAALLMGVLFVALPRRMCHVVMLLCLAVSLSLLNGAPLSPYFAESLEVWEQGRFIRFHGLSQWLGWLWPFAALVFGLLAVSRSTPVPSRTL
ncbi:VanZ family protein [Hydrogenophaga sp.]|uniref:VanZ family protein n=1 Tax=Hydrogenophaga sp. TaxID=1904254 RepID=UPI00272F7DE2|nr:VanZ family protein [Hydrogenophaga sp.]MDP1684299.1 VanZ family protein [Hydrogenophaga sp.]